jgi:nucleoside-diphosphate-sugar epimerase
MSFFPVMPLDRATITRMPGRMPKKVLILGATGPTGLLTARKALEHDHIVTIYARNPSKVPTDISDVANVKAGFRILGGI